MSFKCIVCENSLSFVFPGQDDRNVVATNCGHVFHHVCISKWIRIKTRQFERFADPTDRYSMHCPFSCPNMSTTFFHRLFLEERGDGDTTRTVPSLLNSGLGLTPTPPPPVSKFTSRSRRIEAEAENQEEAQAEARRITRELTFDIESEADSESTMRRRNGRGQSSNASTSNVAIPSTSTSAGTSTLNPPSMAASTLISALNHLQLVDDDAYDENSNNIGPLPVPASVLAPKSKSTSRTGSIEASTEVVEAQFAFLEQSMDSQSLFGNNSTTSSPEAESISGSGSGTGSISGSNSGATSPGNNGTNESGDEAGDGNPLEVPDNPFEGWNVGDQVIWAYDLHAGVIKWMGLFRNQPYTGVEFVEPIGNYMRLNSEFPDINCRPGYGRLVRLSDLRKWASFNGDFGNI